MATMTALSTVTVGAGGAATISFSSIPQTYTDLVVKVCGRSTATGSVYDDLGIYFNSSTADLSWRILYGTGGSASTTSGSTRYFAFVPSASATASTFSNVEYYIPNYAGSNNKSVSADSVTENNGATALTNIAAGLWSNTSAITTITLNPANGNFVEHSTATLYGVFKGPQTLPSTPTIGTATASFQSASVTFTPTSATGVDVSYTALSSPGSITATGTSSPITVSGLTNGTAYTFQVRANNPGGSSAYSSASNSVTPTASAYESIASTLLTGSAATISFGGIPTTYKHLQIRISGRDDRGGTALNNLHMQVNGDTGTNYTNHTFFGGYGTAAQAYGGTGANKTDYVYEPSSGANANVFGAVIFDIQEYSNTNIYKVIRSLGGYDNAGSGRLGLSTNLWLNTAAINSVSFSLSGGGVQFVAGTMISLYGIRG